MLIWLKFFLFLFFLTLVSLAYNYNSLFFLLFHSEVLLITLFFLFLWAAVNFSINFLIGLGLCYLTLGGLEIALSFLLFTL